MNILYISTIPAAAWRKAIAQALPDAHFWVWGDDDINPDDVDYILTWAPPPGVLATFPRAKAIFNLGAGVDTLLQDPSLIPTIPIVRLVDPALSTGMTAYMVHWVLHFHRDFHTYARQQTTRTWQQHTPHNTQKRRIGILGLGELGQDVAHALLMLGFESLAGWSRSAKNLPGVESFVGPAMLDDFLARTEILLCVLPHTTDTQGLLNAKTLATLPKGAFVINAGRGSLVVETDMVQALKSGHIQAAAFDVFKTEPLAQDHPYWGLENMFITPHVASITYPKSAAKVIADGIFALEHGTLPDNVVDLKMGY